MFNKKRNKNIKISKFISAVLSPEKIIKILDKKIKMKEIKILFLNSNLGLKNKAMMMGRNLEI
tara:strand:- start:1 stop:189 length:189 start_codon:yes stop_codon:yes gene_type:complete